MPYCGQPELVDYLNFSTSMQAPIKAVVCTYASGEGAGMGLALFSMFVYGSMGLGLTIRAQHPAPVLVAGMLSASVIIVPALAAQIMALVLFFGISALGLYIYQRAQSAL